MRVNCRMGPSNLKSSPWLQPTNGCFSEKKKVEWSGTLDQRGCGATLKLLLPPFSCGVVVTNASNVSDFALFRLFDHPHWSLAVLENEKIHRQQAFTEAKRLCPVV